MKDPRTSDSYSDRKLFQQWDIYIYIYLVLVLKKRSNPGRVLVFFVFVCEC